MRIKDGLIILLCLMLSGGLLFTASTRTQSIHQAREDLGLVANTSLENAPPSLAFVTVAMGAFRGLIVDVLWMRADTLKQEGKFFDAKQLAEWITILQPRFAKVWIFQAWNMAYNISVAIPNTQPEERWRWVQNGYQLLRDRGIEVNPKEIELYRELGWIFLHKIAGVSDDSHKYYKRELALSMRELLGEKPSNKYFESLMRQPEDLEQVLANEKTASFVHELMQADETFSDKNKLVDNYLALRKTPLRFKKEAFEVIEKYRGTESLDEFELFARAWKLRREWKFDIHFMDEMNRTYGPVRTFEDPNDRLPLNWEHPATHAIYWAAVGLRKAGLPDQYRIDEKNTERIFFHGLQDLFRRGKVVLYDVPGEKPSIYLLPDLRMFETCDAYWKGIIKKYEALENGNPKAVKTGHKNFLENAVMMYYQGGHERYAQKIYSQLQREHRYDPQGYERPEYRGSMISFLRGRLKDELDAIGDKDAVEFIIAVLKNGYLHYAIHEDDEAAGKESYAQEIHDVYQKETASGQQERMGIPSMDWFRHRAFIAFLIDPMYPDYMKDGLLGRLQIERPDLFEKLKKQQEFLEAQQQRMQQQQP